MVLLVGVETGLPGQSTEVRRRAAAVNAADAGSERAVVGRRLRAGPVTEVCGAPTGHLAGSRQSSLPEGSVTTRHGSSPQAGSQLAAPELDDPGHARRPRRHPARAGCRGGGGSWRRGSFGRRLRAQLEQHPAAGRVPQRRRHGDWTRAATRTARPRTPRRGPGRHCRAAARRSGPTAVYSGRSSMTQNGLPSGSASTTHGTSCWPMSRWRAPRSRARRTTSAWRAPPRTSRCRRGSGATGSGTRWKHRSSTSPSGTASRVSNRSGSSVRVWPPSSDSQKRAQRRRVVGVDAEVLEVHAPFVPRTTSTSDVAVRAMSCQAGAGTHAVGRLAPGSPPGAAPRVDCHAPYPDHRRHPRPRPRSTHEHPPPPAHRAALRRRRGRGSARSVSRRRAAGRPPAGAPALASGAASAGPRRTARAATRSRPVPRTAAAVPSTRARDGGDAAATLAASRAAARGGERRRRDLRRPGRPGRGHAPRPAARHPAARLRARPRRRARPVAARAPWCAGRRCRHEAVGARRSTDEVGRRLGCRRRARRPARPAAAPARTAVPRCSSAGAPRCRPASTPPWRPSEPTRVTVGGTDPRTAPDALTAVRGRRAPRCSPSAPASAPPRGFTQRVRTARHARELPGGGLLPFPGRRMVALYGHPQTAALGMLGEQSAAAVGARGSRALADEYAALTKTPVVPAFELIATVAAGSRAEGRLLLAAHPGAHPAAVGAGRRAGRRLRRARPPAGPRRLPHPGQGLRGAAPAARGSGSRSTRSGACSPARSRCARSARSASTRSTGRRLAGRARARARPAAQGADPAPVQALDGARPRAPRHLARRGAVAGARRRPGWAERQAGHLGARCGATCPRGCGSAGRTSRTRTPRCSRRRRPWRRCTRPRTSCPTSRRPHDDGGRQARGGRDVTRRRDRRPRRSPCPA